ncbi:MAG: helix-turn-helix transcriptional regulator [Phycisphaerales bacterium]|nr:helix-turn-helix transcriptional regulator [Phycisphaerales bacterium]
MKTATETLRSAVREFCDSGGTLYYLARAARMSRPSIIHFLSGKQSLRLDLADRLIRFLNLELVATGPLPVQPITPRAAALKRARSPGSRRKASKSSTSTRRPRRTSTATPTRSAQAREG